MTDAPERIWAHGEPNIKKPGEVYWDAGTWELEIPPGATSHRWTGYVRADLHDARAAERDALAARVEALEGTQSQAACAAPPLSWQKKDGYDHWVANNPLGECWIKKYAGQQHFTLYGPGHYGPNNNFPTLEAAKEAAESYYRAHDRDALAARVKELEGVLSALRGESYL